MARTKIKKRKYTRRDSLANVKSLKKSLTESHASKEVATPAVKSKVVVSGELTVTQTAIDANLRGAIESLSVTLSENAQTIRRNADAAHNNSEALRSLVNVLNLRIQPVAVGVTVDGQTYFPPKAAEQQKVS